VLADVGEQEQHQQRPVARVDVGEVRRLAGRCVAAFDVPSGVVRLFDVREPQRKGAQLAPRLPAPRPDQHIQRIEQHRRSGRLGERRLRHTADPVDGSRPGAGIVGFRVDLVPQQAHARIDDARGDSLVDSYEAVPDNPVGKRSIHVVEAAPSARTRATE
jgi:hypothetical protein